MKFLISVCVLIFVSLASTMADDVLEHKWARHLAAYPHQFDTQEEHDFRMSLFAATDAKINEHNSDESQSYTMVHNAFSTKTSEEMASHLGKKASARRSMMAMEPLSEIDDRALPTALDIRTATACGKQIPVKNQLSCGGCWAFSTIAPIEYTNCVAHSNKYTLLSEQQLISCDTNDGGCNGGDPSNAFSWIMSSKKGAVATSASYPFTSGGGSSGSCKSTGLTTGATLKTWTMLQCAAIGGTASVTTSIMNALNTNGVLSVCVYVSNNFQSYHTGVFSDSTCSKLFKGCGPTSTTNHCVSIVGYGTDSVSKKDYWILRNQWGTSWGLSGYMWIQKGVNMCGIESEVYYTTVA